MSWSVMCAGTPDKVAEALEKYAEKQTGYCKAEFDAALPNLIGLVRQNVMTPDYPYEPKSQPVIRLEAYGSGTWVDGKLVQGHCSVKIEPIWGFVG